MSNTPLLSRRTLLRGLGTAVALPMLDAMMPGNGIVQAAATGLPNGAKGAAPVRSAFMFIPNGVNYPEWTPTGEGAGFKLSKLLEPLEKVKADINVLTGLTLDNARAKGDGPGDHARSAAAFLTGAHPVKTSGRDIRLGVSVDQVAAAQIGTKTKLPSLELGLDKGQIAGECDSGYSCAYVSNISWRSDTNPMPKEIDPASLFDRLFGSGEQRSAVDAARQAKRRKSVLDYVAEDSKRLEKKLGASDRHKLDEFATSIREIEKRIDAAKLADAAAPMVKPTMDRPDGIPGTTAAHMKLMVDLLVLAFQTDQTRIATVMVARDGSNRNFPDLGITEGHHSLSHHGGAADKVAAIQRIDRFHMEQLAYFIERLKSVKEGSGTLLDNTQLLCGSGIGDGNRHNHENLPIVWAGKAGGQVKTGRHVVYPRNTPLCNLYLNMLEMAGTKADRFGDSDGRLANLG
ncbi:MAG: diguanylate cyclase/phosphodiesterase (GGDEF & EAL domains) with PAS/PAC sensor(s) [uncultured Phycisphaerae bacterium]|uniref:Diguanylate cyclase/phosphodiesterase (GGDEF & EAL domains) with PAS/PAC sensor(S) n=1 Tax=uncultured Phycisphaerae bacterium TaxID=904963 RepID=A0A6J4NJ44_9BACT|nr:MAG: diguanylate cyclase/phosphodiesterase (GGDEF & EAL domains) with PAS/PAC sensor(s) [uncultured Phycisphaerae bacterium]